jgi:uncharacterized protein (TIGR03435 family)
VHRENKEMSALMLTVGKNGHKLKQVETEEQPSFKTGKLNLTGKGATIAQLIEFLSRELRHPIIDQTGLSGRFDYFLDIAPYFTEEMQRNGGPGGGPPPDAPGIVAQALQAQLDFAWMQRRRRWRCLWWTLWRRRPRRINPLRLVSVRLTTI